MRHQRFLRYVDEVARAGSIRKAAERLNLTASALNRRVMDIEDELGTLLFERRARGVRLTSAGEIFVRHLRVQLADTERMQSQIEDLKGMRRGIVRIACSQALAHGFLPSVVTEFQRTYPLIVFEVSVCDHERAMQMLAAYEVEIVLVFRPPFLPNFQALATIKQRLVAVMSSDHPLAASKNLRLSDCAPYPLALPEPSIGGRQLLEEVADRGGVRLHPTIQSNSFEFLRGCVAESQALSFQITVGALPDDLAKYSLVARDIDPRDLPESHLALGQLRGRHLSIAAAMFCEQLKTSLSRVGTVQ
jgi:DNA-binding transcriptional LysR family regulator